MMIDSQKMYWDSCIWIAYINKDNVKLKGQEKYEDRFSMCDSVLEAAKRGRVVLVTSALTLAEVYYKSADVVRQTNCDFEKFFDHEYILLIPLNKKIATMARSLQQSMEKFSTRGKHTRDSARIRPADAIHLASAQRSNSAIFHTFDNSLLKQNGKLRTSNGTTLTICKPDLLSGLNGGLQQDSLFTES